MIIIAFVLQLQFRSKCNNNAGEQRESTLWEQSNRSVPMPKPFISENYERRRIASEQSV